LFSRISPQTAESLTEAYSQYGIRYYSEFNLPKINDSLRKYPIITYKIMLVLLPNIPNSRQERKK